MYFVENVDVKVDPTKILQNLITLYFNHDYDSICKILKIEKSKNHRDNIPSDKYYKRGMIFCGDENPRIQARVRVDDETKYALNTILMVSSNSIDEKGMIDIIIDKWIKNVQIVGLLKSNYIPEIVGEETHIKLEVSKNKWNDLLLSCRNKGIPLKIGFKMAISNFLIEC